MAKLERTLQGDFDAVLRHITEGITGGSVTATLEDASDFTMGAVRCSVRVFERYSYMGGNRLSLSVTLFGCDNEVHLSAITAGGSSAMFFKMNTIGEEAFLEKLAALLPQ